MSIYKGQLTLCGITYCVEVINGVKYINGKSVSDFVDTLSIEQVREFAKIGARAVDAERNGEEYRPMQDYREMQLKRN